MLIFHNYIYESPKWLLLHNNNNKAVVIDILKQLRNPDDDIEQEIETILTGIKEENSDNNSDHRNITWADVFVWKHAVIIGCGLMFIQVIFKKYNIIYFICYCNNLYF